MGCEDRRYGKVFLEERILDAQPEPSSPLEVHSHEFKGRLASVTVCVLQPRCNTGVGLGGELNLIRVVGLQSQYRQER